MAKKKEKDIGGWFEQECEKYLKPLCSKRGKMFYKFPDSKSSRGLVTAQPGEFMLLFENGAALIECKASKKHSSFRSCMSSMVRDSQYGWHKRWYLSGNPSFFVFYSEKAEIIEIWDGRDIVEARSNSKPLKSGGASQSHFLHDDVTIETAMQDLAAEAEYLTTK